MSHFIRAILGSFIYAGLLVLIPGFTQAQSEGDRQQKAVIDSVLIEGNKKTRTRLVLRELQFKAGDSILIQDTAAILEFNRLRLMNLGMFSSSEISAIPANTSGHIKVMIKVVENWFIYPVPLFELADRNFNVWWKEQKRSLRRVNYGIDCNHINLTGNADGLKLKAQFGYSNKYELAYKRPNINKNQTLGLNTSVSYSRQHELAITTKANKLEFRRNREVWQIEQYLAFSTLSWRPGLFTTQAFSLEFRRNKIADSVAQFFNPDFFLRGRTIQRHLNLIYNYTADYRDNRPYPWKGWLMTGELRQNGILPTDDLHLFRAFFEYVQFMPLRKGVSLEAGVKARTSLPRKKPPYFNNQGLGYGGTFVRGYEYYVVDGFDFGILKTAFHIRFFNRTFNFPKWMPLAFRKIPLQLLFSVNNDIGYVNDPYYSAGNPLANKLLYGNGFGLDIVAYYNKTARLEYTRNHLGEWGFYVRTSTGF